MYEEVKKKVFKSSLFLTILWFIIGGVLVGIMANNMWCILFGYTDFTTLAPEEMKHQLVTYDMEANFGSYMEEYEYNKDTNRRTTTDLYYIIRTGDETAEEFRYMTVKVPASMEKQMDQMAETTFAGYYSDPITITGRIEKLSEEEYGYFVEFFVEIGWSEEEIAEATLPYYIDSYNKSYAETGFILLFSVGVFFLVWGIIRLIKAFNGGYLKKLKKDIAKSGYNEVTIESDYNRTIPVKEKDVFRVGRLMTYFMLGADVRAIPNNKIVWAYMNTTVHRTNGIKTGTTFDVHIETDGAGGFSIGVDKEEMALRVLKQMEEQLPWVIVGYSDELKKLYCKNREEFLNLRYNTMEHTAVEPDVAGFEAFMRKEEI